VTPYLCSLSSSNEGVLPSSNAENARTLERAHPLGPDPRGGVRGLTRPLAPPQPGRSWAAVLRAPRRLFLGVRGRTWADPGPCPLIADRGRPAGEIMKPCSRPQVFRLPGPPNAIGEPGMVASSALSTIPNHCLAAAPVASSTTRIIDLSQDCLPPLLLRDRSPLTRGE